jgi:hypothetical protein
LLQKNVTTETYCDVIVLAYSLGIQYIYKAILLLGLKRLPPADIIGRVISLANLLVEEKQRLPAEAGRDNPIVLTAGAYWNERKWPPVLILRRFTPPHKPIKKSGCAEKKVRKSG